MRAPLNLAAMSRFSISWNPFIVYLRMLQGKQILAGSKKGEFVILGAKKGHYCSLRFAMKNLKIHIHDRGEKSWPGGPFMRKCGQISSYEGYITSSPYTAIERGRRQHLKQTTSAP